MRHHDACSDNRRNDTLPARVFARKLRAAIAFATLLVAPLTSAATDAVAGPGGASDAKSPSVAVAAWTGAQDLASYALGLIGVEYRFGGASPERGLDCSGLVQYVFEHVTGVELPRTAKAMSRLGRKIRLDDLEPGDLVFFNTHRYAYSHVGIYLGDQRFIHAPRKGGEVEVVALSRDYWQKHFDGARRLIGVLPELMPPLISNANAQAAEAPAAAIVEPSEPNAPR